MKKIILIVLSLLLSIGLLRAQSGDLGRFSTQQDVGHPKIAGSASYDSSTGTYSVSGGGTNMWAKNDDFHFVSKQMSGDLSFSANVRFPKPGGNPHRKACLIIRQTLDGDSPYVDVAFHGSGLAALQFRETKGDRTQEIQTSFPNPARIGLVKRGDYVSFWISEHGEELHPAGGSFKLPFKEPFYVGLAACAHDNAAIEQAEFSKVELDALPALAPDAKPEVQSTLEIMPVNSTDRMIVWHTNVNIQAPNWTKDNRLVFNSGGQIYVIGITNGTTPVQIPMQEGITNGQSLTVQDLTNINNDHGISPDGLQLAISAGSPSRIYVGLLTGGVFKQITPTGPSYFHGWSPDGNTLAFCGQRSNEFDVYTVPVTGGDETRLTTAPGLDDGPEYSPDGQYIYFNSERSGLMQIWCMNADGSNQTQVTPNDEHNNWFPHISPDGKRMVFLTFNRDVPANKHPANKDVMLRMVDRGKIVTLAKFYGGQGTINVASWSPDSRSVAYVTYTLVYR
jgi:dipeptidyl aminopeptidase/acylaminoacyl peptidase